MIFSHSRRADEYIEALRHRLSDRTLRHSIGAAELMATLVSHVEIGHDDAVTAGLLHDLCKGLDDDALLQKAADYAIPIRETQRRKPGLLHGPVAAEEIRRLFGVEDESIRDAIRWHTTGRPEWGLLGLALYVADFAEKTRDHAESAEARERLEKNGFRDALLFVSRRKLDYIRQKPHVDPTTEAFHAWLEKEWA